MLRRLVVVEQKAKSFLSLRSFENLRFDLAHHHLVRRHQLHLRLHLHRLSRESLEAPFINRALIGLPLFSYSALLTARCNGVYPSQS